MHSTWRVYACMLTHADTHTGSLTRYLKNVRRFELISGTVIPCGLGKKPIVLCGELMNINEWAGLNT